MLIDCHCHIAPTATVTRPDGAIYPTPEQLLAILDQHGIDRAVILPGASPECRSRFVTTEEVIDIAAAHPDRFIPFCNLDPRMDRNDASADFSRFLEYYKAAGCRGLGELTANMLFDDPMVWNLFAQCEAYEMPVTFHIAPQLGGYYGLVDDLHLPRLEATLQKFPNLIFFGHSQPFWAEMGPDVTPETRNGYPQGPVGEGGRLPELFERYPNLHGDLSANSGYNAISRDPEFGCAFLDRFQDRLLFGNDIASADTSERPLPGYLRRLLADGHISQTIFDKITFLNANRLLNLGLEAIEA